MPELPDLEIIREVLDSRLTGQTITSVEVVRPLVMRDLTGQGFARTLTSQTIAGVERRGKVLLFPLQSGLTLAINCKLAGRLQYARPTERRLPKHGRAVDGIGNAYADEICFAARVHPYRKRTSLTDAEIVRLYEAMQSVLRQAIATLRERVGTDIHREVRDFLAVHGQGGEPCPACGDTIAEIRARGRVTNFCRACQPGGLVRR